MVGWSDNEWIIMALTFIAGLLLGMFFLAGGKWKRRYREEVARREAVEAERDTWAARSTAATDRINQLERSQHAPAAAPTATGTAGAAAAGAGAGGIIGRMTGRNKHDDLSRIRGIGPNGQSKLHEFGIHRYEDLEKLDDRRKAELEGSIGVQPGHVDREHWPEQARMLREGKHDEHAKLYPER